MGVLIPISFIFFIGVYLIVIAYLEYRKETKLIKALEALNAVLNSRKK